MLETIKWCAQEKSAPYIISNYNYSMPEYRRTTIEGGSYFFTLVTYQRRKFFDQSFACSLLHDSISHIQKYHPFNMIAFCLLPDHVHFIWQLPENDNNYSVRISQIKRRFSKHLMAKNEIALPQAKSRESRRELPIWQRRFWEHYLRDVDDLNQHIDYVHYNPVKHGLVNRVRDWENSSFFDYVQIGVYDLDWGENCPVANKSLQHGK